MVSGSDSAEDSVPQAWDLYYPVSAGRLIGGPASPYVRDLADAFEGGTHARVPLESVASKVERTLSESERLPRNELLALLREGVAFDSEDDGRYPESFDELVGSMLRLSDDNQWVNLQDDLVFFWMG